MTDWLPVIKIIIHVWPTVEKNVKNMKIWDWLDHYLF